MDYETCDNDSDPEPTEEEYTDFVNWLSGTAASELRAAKGDPEQQKQALCRYYKRGEKANLTAGELVDFLGVSTPSILDMAGYTDEEADAVMELSSTLCEDIVVSASPLDPLRANRLGAL